MKEKRLLIAGICFFAAAVANFCLAFMGNGNNFAIRIFDGIIFFGCLCFAWREWRKQKQ